MNKNNQILERAKIKHRKGEIYNAIKLYEKIISFGYNNHQISYLVGTAYLQLDNHKKAIYYLSLSLKFKNDFINAYNNKIYCIY